MTHEDQLDFLSAPRRYRGPQGLGEDAASALGASDAAGQSLGGMAQEDRLLTWAQEAECVVAELGWLCLTLVSVATAENEVRYRASDHRAVKRTWPGTFGFVPSKVDNAWKPRPATPLEYLHRMHLQNDLFLDDVRMEGVMRSDGPSMIIGQRAGGMSIVISQRWLDAADPSRPHPDEKQIADYVIPRGFTRLFDALYGWEQEDGRFIILDAKPDNFVLTVAGLLPIDLLITELDLPPC